MSEGQWRPYEPSKEAELRANVEIMRAFAAECTHDIFCKYQGICRRPGTCQLPIRLVK